MNSLKLFLAMVFGICYSFFSVVISDSSDVPEKTFKSPSTKMEFIYLPGGCYMMGSENGFHFERPVHEVCVDPFYIGRYEVTQKQWVAIMGNNPSKFKGEDRPVDRVSWLDATAFIKKLNERESDVLYRLPTEAEWEYAARAGTTTVYYWGDEVDNDYVWYYGTSKFQTHPVGIKKSNRFGLFDMLGNVWEWTSDWFSADYYQKSPKDNPPGPENGKYRVRRGGSSANLTSHIRSATRYRGKPDRRHHILGLRVVRSIQKHNDGSE